MSNTWYIANEDNIVELNKNHPAYKLVLKMFQRLNIDMEQPEGAGPDDFSVIVFCNTVITAVTAYDLDRDRMPEIMDALTQFFADTKEIAKLMRAKVDASKVN